MIKLIQLELKKHRFSTMVWTGAIITLSVLALTLMVGLIEQWEGIQSFEGDQEYLMMIDTLIRASFIIYSSVLIAKFVIDEYKNRTITLLFSYPVSRKKLFVAKLSIIFSFTFIAIVLANLLVSAAFLFSAEHLGLLKGTLNVEWFREHAITVFMQAAAAAGIGLIPLFFGMLKKSVPTTIVSSLFIVAVVNSNNNGFSLSSILAIPITLACIGLLFAWLAIRKVNDSDVM